MSPRIILASVLGISVLCSGAALAQTSPSPGGGTSGTTGTTGTSGGSMGSGTHGTSGTPSGTMNSQLQKDHSATTPSPYMGAGKGTQPGTGMGNGGVQTAPNSAGQGSGKSGY
jgi:hypothetical protein